MLRATTQRLSIIAQANGVVVLNTLGAADGLRVLVADRLADGIGFPGEHVVRLPRTLWRRGYRLSGGGLARLAERNGWPPPSPIAGTLGLRWVR